MKTNIKEKIEKFECKNCGGYGYIEKWEGGNLKSFEKKAIEDCDVCNGKGYVDIKVIDRRVNSKKEKLEYEKEY